MRRTLEGRRYRGLRNVVIEQHPGDLGQPLGEFLLSLKQRGDPFYREFLNPHGDEVYCSFRIEGALAAKKGLYCFCVGGDVMYIGRSHDPFEKRMNTGYGQISPKNCYLDGQSTNCHLNSIIEQERRPIQYFVCALEVDNSEIDKLETELLGHYQPPWNVKMK